MSTVRFVLCAATLSALVSGSEPAASQGLVLCDKNHFILSLQCLPPNFQIPPVPPGVKRWTAIGPDGANVVALVVDPVTPSTTFAGTLGSGVLKTTDGGTSWATANGGLPTTNVLALAIDPVTPSTLYAGTDAGVFKSADAGRNWTAANAGLDGASVTLAIDPASPATVYAVSAGRLFKTTDGTATWTLSGGLSQYSIYSIAIDPTSTSTVYVGAGDNINDSHSGVLKSTDGGATWTQIYTVPCEDRYFGCVDGWPYPAALAIDPRLPSRLYVTSVQGTLGISTDGGATWSNNQMPDAFMSLAVDPTSSTTLYATTLTGALFRTTDSGKTWTRVADGPRAPSVIAMTASAPATIFAGGSTGVYRSSDAAETWTRLTLGVTTVAVYPLAVDPSASPTVYAAMRSGVMKTTDGGAHWTESSAGLSADLFIDRFAVDPVSPSIVYAVQSTPFNGRTVIYKTTDAGAHWARASNVSFNPAALRAIAIAPTQPSTLFIGVNSEGVLKSTDGGSSWALVNNGLTAAGPYVSAVAVDPTKAETVYAATDPTGQPDTPAKIFKSTDGAAHWRQISVPVNAEITSIVVDPATPSTIYASYADYGDPGQSGVFKSSDGGGTWVAASQDLPPTASISALRIDPNSPSHVYAATSAGAYMSADGATTWAPINAGLPHVAVWDLAIDRTGSVLRAATIAGLFEYKISNASPLATVSVIEYYHAAFDHYFITAIPEEITLLNKGFFVGWTRTGLQFKAYAAEAIGTSPVCRFFTTAFGPKSSNFHTPFASECAAVQANPDWLLESGTAFYIALPAFDGSCATGLTPVYRLYNRGQGGAPNHRYTTDVTARAQMIAQGWIPEGLGSDAVEMCSPP
jgi:photosystem II stability/assembly factor-like uncharacterized protein